MRHKNLISTRPEHPQDWPGAARHLIFKEQGKFKLDLSSFWSMPGIFHGFILSRCNLPENLPAQA